MKEPTNVTPFDRPSSFAGENAFSFHHNPSIPSTPFDKEGRRSEVSDCFRDNSSERKCGFF